MNETRDFPSAILRALNGSNPTDVISGVKEAVAEKLTELDQHVDVHFTDYFNHSYMPDMILSWQESGRRRERPLFVRTDVDPTGIAADIHSLVPQSPMILAVDERSGGEPARQAVVEEQERRGRVDLLMTDSSSVATMAPPAAMRSGDYNFSRLLGDNFLSGGRGYVGEVEASLLQAAAHLEDGQNGFDEFSLAVDQFFMEDAATRLKRSTSLVRSVVSGDIDGLSLSGKFTQAELRTVLPLLLENSLARTTPRVWTELGAVMTLADLFDIANDLEELDVSPLLNANLGTWVAKRSQVVMSMAEDSSLPDDTARTAWSLWRGLLALDIGNWRILFADDARKLKGRSSRGKIPQWQDIVPILHGFRIGSVQLEGLARRVSISAQDTADINRDISTVANALEETFFVPRMTLLNVKDDVEVSSVVEFSEMLITSTPSDTLANLAKAATNLLLHDRAILSEPMPVEVRASVEVVGTFEAE